MTVGSAKDRRRGERCCRAGSALAAAACGTLAVATVLVEPSAAEAVGGEAVVVTPQDGSSTAGTPLAGGDATTPFSLKLPSNAACTGDSTDGGYRVQSFMVRHEFEPANLTFGPLGPLPRGVGQDFRQPLYAVSSTPLANAATNLADEPGGEGTIINIPSFSLGVFKPSELHAGRYTVGIACTKGPASSTQLDRYWTAELVLTAPLDPSALPGWAAPGSAEGAGSAASPGSTVPASTTTMPVAPAQPVGVGSDGAETVDPGAPTTAEPSMQASPASGEPPSFQVPAAALVSSLSIAGGPVRSLLIWAALAVLLARAAYLLARRPVLASP